VCAKKLALAASVLISMSLVPLCPASARDPETGELEQLKQQVQELVYQLGEMRRQHGAQIEALDRKIAALSRGGPAEVDDLQALRRAAEAEATKEAKPEQGLEEKIFKSGNLGLQALNPEISITGDLLGSYRTGDEVVSWDWFLRGLGLHLESYLDPYSRFKSAIHFGQEGAELEELYLTRYGVYRGVNLTFGKFRQQLGVVNRWHKHALDWFDHPVPLMALFGHEGLNQTGASLDWSGSLGEGSQELELQVTDGENERMFGENSKNRPAVLAHYRLYRDLSPSTYVELGGTGMIGWNDTWATLGPEIEDSLKTFVYGLDFTLAWEPTDRMRYRNLEWRSELYFTSKKIHRPDGLGTDKLHPWGGYSSLQAKVSRTIDLGARFDYYRADHKSYAELTPDLSLAPLAVTDSDGKRYLVGGYATWWQSPFVRFRLGYEYEGGTAIEEDQGRATFQVVFAAGPHKHERY
jgi:hypothetical protein